MSDFHVVLATAVRRERERLGLRPVDLAERLGWPVSRVTRMENARCQVRVVDLPALCRALGVTLSTLLREASPADLRALKLPTARP